MPDFHEPCGQKMQTEAPHKLLNFQTHGFALGPVCAVLPSKGHFLGVRVQCEQAPWAESYPVSVARKVSQHLPRAAERSLSINHPLLARSLTHQLLVGFGPAEGCKLPIKL